MEHELPNNIKRAEKGSLGETKMVTFKLPVQQIEKIEKLTPAYGNKTAVIRAAIDNLNK